MDSKSAHECLTHWMHMQAELKSGDVHVDFVVSDNNIRASVYIFNCDDLLHAHNVLKTDIDKHSGGGSMCATTKDGECSVTIFPTNAVFPGCRLEDKEVLVRERPAEPEHYETRRTVICGDDDR